MIYINMLRAVKGLILCSDRSQVQHCIRRLKKKISRHYRSHVYVYEPIYTALPGSI